MKEWRVFFIIPLYTVFSDLQVCIDSIPYLLWHCRLMQQKHKVVISRNMRKTCSFGHLSFLGADIGNDLPEERES